MSINVNSTQISALLQLYPMAIPGAEENLQPPGAYHLGISESIYSPSTQLSMVIDPFMLFSTPSQAGDSVRLWVNSQATSVIKPINPGEENDRIFLKLPWGVLKNGLNTLYYEVTRVGSGNKDKSDPILNVLFNNPVSGITVSHPPSIGPGQPATFTLTRSYPREYDEGTLTMGTWSKTIPYVHPANPISYTLTTTDLQQIGDGTHPVSARVIDQLTNSNVSPTTSITITANQKVYNPPIIVQGEPGKILDVPALNGKDATIQGLIWTAIAVGQQVWLKLTGQKPDGSTVTLQIWNGGASQVNATWVSQGFWPKPLPASFLSQLADGSSLRMEFWVSEDKSNNFATATKFADQVYTVITAASVVLAFLNAPYTAPAGGQVTGIELLVTQAGQPAAGHTVTITLPQGTTFTDGTSRKDFTTGADGKVTVSGVTAGSVQGVFSMTASSGREEVSARLDITEKEEEGIIPINDHLADVKISPDGKTVYVLAFSHFYAIETSTLKIISSVDLGVRTRRMEMGISHDGVYLYFVGLATGGKSVNIIEVFDPITGKVVSSSSAFPSNTSPSQMLISSDTKFIYIGTFEHTPPPNTVYHGKIWKFNTTTMRIEKSLAIPNVAKTTNISKISTISKDNSLIYAFNNQYQRSVSAWVISTANLSIIKTISTSYGIRSVILDPDEKNIFVAGAGSNIDVYDAKSYSKKRTINIAPLTFVVQLRFDPSGRYLYILGMREISTLEMSTEKIIYQTTFPWKTPIGFVITSNGKRAFVASYLGAVQAVRLS
ncbi:YncE family protein [Pseudomonas sp. IzPS59]|uniref:YncE family protein n=1 Tax=Pseudomonas sp. IzPS59 TaxID=2774459 RepID=UPI001787D27E|nr:hypothetical protein [Pseudomonas sp. IzPS59]